jgi:hypothetical protein
MCDDLDEVIYLVEAIAALGTISRTNKSRASLNQWASDCVNAQNYEIVLLHTSNAYSRDYYQLFLNAKCVVLFTDDPSNSWAAPGENPRPTNAPKPINRTQLREYACDFICEYRLGVPPPWEAFEGKSRAAMVRARLFSCALILDVPNAKQEHRFESGDLSKSDEIKSMLTRILGSEAENDCLSAAATLNREPLQRILSGHALLDDRALECKAACIDILKILCPPNL